VDFFGGKTRMPPGPAILALRTGAPLYAVDMWYSEHRVEARLRRITPPVDGRLDERVKRTTQLIADAFANGIADHPQDWHMLQKLWIKG
jgi:phosphatidylinositol dimannoside acyltransferase